MRPSALPILLILPGLLGQAPAVVETDPAARARRDFLRELYLADASSYAVYRDPGRREKAELRREPAYVWTNPTRNRGQDGHVFVWTYRGVPRSSARSSPRRPSAPARSSTSCTRCRPRSWSSTGPALRGGPRSSRVVLKPIPGAPSPARSAPQRLAQMRALIREFSASAVDIKGERWELRVLAQPLYRYESTDPDVLDGALFTLVSTAGTDPELIVVLEARKAPGEPPSATSWQFAAARFSDMALTVRHKDRVVYTAPVIAHDAAIKDPTHRYHLINDRTIPPVEESAPTTPKEPGANP